MKKIFLYLFLFSSSAVAVGPPLNLKCGKDNYILYESVSNQHAAIKNDVLMSSTSATEKPYGDDENAIIIEFDEWGENGGMHIHHFIVFDTVQKKVTLQKRTLDADNTPRSDAITETCTVKK